MLRLARLSGLSGSDVNVPAVVVSFQAIGSLRSFVWYAEELESRYSPNGVPNGTDCRIACCYLGVTILVHDKTPESVSSRGPIPRLAERSHVVD